jgi:hypothetical protein
VVVATSKNGGPSGPRLTRFVGCTCPSLLTLLGHCVWVGRLFVAFGASVRFITSGLDHPDAYRIPCTHVAYSGPVVLYPLKKSLVDPELKVLPFSKPLP